MIYIAISLIFSGILLEVANLALNMSDALWFLLFDICKDAQILGAVTTACILCDYTCLRLKCTLYLLCVWRVIVLIVNATPVHEYTNIYIMVTLTIIYLLCLYRMRLPEITSKDPGDEAYNILLPINSYKGLFQAVFLFWHPARYETRAICDGNYIWSINNGYFVRRSLDIRHTDPIPGVKVPLGRRLNSQEISTLNNLAGSKAMTGIRDCRKFLII